MKIQKPALHVLEALSQQQLCDEALLFPPSHAVLSFFHLQNLCTFRLQQRLKTLHLPKKTKRCSKTMQYYVK